MRSLVLALALLLGTHAQAAEELSGAILKAPATVKALSESGQIETYNVTPILNEADIYEKTLSLSNNGIIAMCGDYYGQLAEDFSVTVKLADGSQKTITVKAASKDRKVSVFGMCQGESRDLDQLQLAVQKGDGPEVK
ncbi:MAG: hypothetical protein ACXVB9_00570 [Bdellovibrionota bacterium]